VDIPTPNDVGQPLNPGGDVMAKAAKAGTNDLYAEVNQGACDKLLDSVTYPFTAFEKSQGFPGCDNLAVADIEPLPLHLYTKTEVQNLLKEALDWPKGENPSIYDDVFAFCGSIIEQAKKVVDAAKSAGSDYNGPDPKLMQAIVEGGIQKLPQTLKPFGDWGVYAWCSYLRVIVKDRPDFQLALPQTDFNKIDLRITATGELWFKHPWWNCYSWCSRWEKVIKCDRIASVTPTIDIAADAYATFKANGSIVEGRAGFKKLRLDYPILRDIPLEGIANLALGNKPVFVYDASQLIETVPVLKSRFTVDKVSLAAKAKGIDVGVTIRKVP
jgi:hypothetical protein